MAELEQAADPRSIAMLIVESIKSPLRGFVYDRRLVDDSIVREVIRSSGVGDVLSRWSRGNIVVYIVDTRKLEALCRYEECRGNGVDAQLCIQRCVNRKIVEVSEALARSMLEAIGATANL